WQQRLAAVERALEARRAELRPKSRQRLEQEETARLSRPREDLAAAIRRLEAEQTACEQQLAELRSQQSRTNRQSEAWSYELQLLESGIRKDQQMLDVFEDEIRKLTIELDKWQPRITRFREAVLHM
ncbi:MAG TPA: hypothetical protein VML55_21800, partial [Planctomycetaceae bacterium]|nr:hypothetical protein [Planctomycetaceae bacterium]